MSLVEKIFGDLNKREVKKIEKIVDKITALDAQTAALSDEELKAKVEALIQARQDARKEKNWAEADRIRDQLKDMGIIIMDSKQGVQWKKA